jgi:hypothetical protein
MSGFPEPIVTDGETSAPAVISQLHRATQLRSSAPTRSGAAGVTARALADVIAMAGAAPELVVVSSSRGIEAVNDAFAHLTRFAADDLAGQPLTTIAHPAARATLEATVATILCRRLRFAVGSARCERRSDLDRAHLPDIVGRGKARLVVSRFAPILDKTLLAALTASQRIARR